MSATARPEIPPPKDLASLPDWPALRGTLPPQVVYERGVWGKAHGAHSDYRWLARSHGFARGRPQLGRQLNLGLEDRPCAVAAWRVVDGACYAVGCYPSRAADAAGRRGFLEKQVLEWHRGDEPAVAVAFLLLAAAAALSDEVWWSRRDRADWSDPAFALPIEEHRLLAASAPQLAEQLAAGLAQLHRSNVDEERLTELYAALLGGQRPACLRGLEQPLPPGALATLLLPLPRELADRLSLSGWIPSSRGVLAELGRNWDVVVCPEGFAAAADGSGHHRDRARRLARALLLGTPEELGEPEERSLAAPATASGEVVAEPSWDDFTAEMRRDLARTTDRLIEKDLWHLWRRHARLQSRERLTTALAWLTSEVWSRRGAPAARIETWDEVLDDVGTLKSAHMKRLCRGGRPTWPWIPPHERRQLADLSAMASDLGDLALLARSIAPEIAIRLGPPPLHRFLLAESPFAGQLPADALLRLLEPPAGL